MGVAILMYHALEDAAHPAGAEGAGERRYVLPAQRFGEQLAYLRDAGFRSFLLPELLALETWPDKAVVLTFDDGHVSDVTLALPLLERYGFKAHFFVTTDWIGTPRYLTAAQVKGLHGAGMGIGSHGTSHRYLNDLNPAEVEQELRGSRDVLGLATGGEIDSFSAPGGRVRSSHAAVACSLGYRFVFTSSPGLFVPDGPMSRIPRFAVRSDTDMETYKAMVHGDRQFLDKQLRRERLLSFAKWVVGNRGYELVRKVILKDFTTWTN